MAGRLAAVAVLACAVVAGALASPGSVTGAGERAESGCAHPWLVEARRNEYFADVAADRGGVLVAGWVSAHGIIARVDGGRWTSTSISDVDRVADLGSDGVSAWAVGTRRAFARQGAADYVYRRDGKRWQRVRVPGLPAARRGLGFHAVDVVGGDVWLVGNFDNSDDVKVFGSRWLSAHLHRGRWHTQTGVSAYADLNALDAVNARVAWAVGGQGPTVASAQEVMLGWDGARWTDTSRYDYVLRLDDVLALSPTNAWAVGSTNLDAFETYARRPAIEHWNGSTWTRVAVPAWRWPVAPSLTSLASFSPRDVWAGGRKFNGSPVLLHWNGSSWKEAPAPPVKTGIAALAAARDGTLWAVGDEFVAHAHCR